jgi:hypothetical protein
MEKKNIHQKLFELQSEVGAISKDMDNPFYKSKYFDVNKLIQHVQPLLQAHRLLLTQPIESGHVVSRVTCVDTLEAISSSLEIPHGIDPQKMGSAVTYLRRYTLQSLLALQAEDDDGNTASNKKPAKEELTPKHPKWNDAVKNLSEGKVSVEKIKKHYDLSVENQLELVKQSEA